MQIYSGLQHYSSGKLHGYCTYYSDDNAIYIECNYYFGLLHGECILYYDANTIISNYIMGRLHGEYKINGELICTFYNGEINDNNIYSIMDNSKFNHIIYVKKYDNINISIINIF